MEKAIPQPRGTFIIGNLNEIDADDSVGSIDRLRKIYGEIFRLSIFGRRLVVISSQELVNFVCDEAKFDKRIGAAVDQLRTVTGDGLFTAHTAEPNWKLAHRILMPAFGPQTIRDMFPAMMDIASQLILRWERFSGDEIDVCDNFTRLTLDTIALCSFNYRFNSFYQTKMHRFVDAMINVLLESGRRTKRLSIQKALMFGTNRRYYDDITYLHTLCDDIVRERRENPNEINDLLNRMINGKDPETGYQLSDENIRFQMVTFLIAGHETTSGLLSFTVYYLLKNPSCLQKAVAEVDQFDEITVDTLSKLKYLDAVLKETLRLSPTAPMISLQCKDESILLPGGYKVNKDEILSIFLMGLHRDPKVWERAEEFLPERMLDGKFEKLPPNSWKPFGNGQRACIGRPFAWQESLLILSLVLKHFHMEFVDPSYDLRIKQTLTIKPDGLKIRVRPRKHFQLPTSTERKLTDKTIETAVEQKPDIDVSNLDPMLVLYGSNSGSCESFARTVASEAIRYGYAGTVATLDSAVEALPNDRPVIIITASYEGKPCDNAKQFVAYLESEPKIDVNFSVFGAGHHDWVNSYQKIPKYIDEMLEKLGGKRLAERGEGDAAGDFYGSFESWKERIFQSINKNKTNENPSLKEKLSIEIVNSNRRFGQINDIGVVLENRILVSASDVGSSVRHLEIRLPKGQTYRSGDYLAILPTNPMEVVSRVLRQFHLTTDTYIKIHSSTETFLPTNQSISAFDLLSGYVELAQPISKKQLETLASCCENDQDKTELLKLSGENYSEEILEKRMNILDILECYPSCQLTFADYLRMLPCLRFRQYSISSSPLCNAEVVTLTFDVLRSPALSGCGQYVGVASNYLAELNQGDRISCSVRTSNMNFHPPEETDTPIVMIAAGTGVAPFRAFIQERAAQLICGRKVGQTILYFGCRSENYFFYKNEFDKWSQLDGIQVKIAYSREENVPKKYVQDLLWEDRQDIVDLYRKGAKFYTCGSASKLGVSVKECFIKIIRDFHQCDEDKAKEIWEKVALDRYSVDVFA